MATATTTQPTGVINAGITRPAASKAVLAGVQPTEDVIRLRTAWARLMDSGERDEADRLLAEIALGIDVQNAIDLGIAELSLIERRALENRRRQTAQHLREARKTDSVTPPPARTQAPAKPAKQVFAPVSHQGKTARNRHKAAERRGRQLARAALHQKGSTSGKK